MELANGNSTTAILVPILDNLPTGLMFQSTTHGMSAQCSSLTFSPVCNNSFPFQGYTVSCHMPNSVATPSDPLVGDPDKNLPNGIYNATIGSVNVNTGDTVTYNLENTSNDAPPLQWWGGNVTNPFGFGQVFDFIAEEANTQDFHSMQFHSSDTYQYYVGACSVSVYDVFLSFTNGTYTITNQTLSDQNTTTLLWGSFEYDYTTNFLLPRLMVNIQAAINQSDFTDILAKQVSQLGIAYVAGVLSTSPATHLLIEEPFIASAYPYAALYLLWGSSLLYVLMGIVLLVIAGTQQGLEVRVVQGVDAGGKARKPEMTSTLSLTHQRLLNPMAIVAEHFVLSSAGNGGEMDAAAADVLSVKEDAMQMFNEAKGPAQGRLHVGFSENTEEGDSGLRHRIFRVAYSKHRPLITPTYGY